MKSAGYIHWGQWWPPKFFVKELFDLYWIHSWVHYFIPLVSWSSYNSRNVYPNVSLLYLNLDLKYYNNFLDWIVNPKIDMGKNIDFEFGPDFLLHHKKKMEIDDDMLQPATPLIEEWEKNYLFPEKKLFDWISYILYFNFFLPDTYTTEFFDFDDSYENFFPSDKLHALWHVKTRIFYQKEKNILNEEYSFDSMYQEDCLNLVNVLYVVWSYIVKHITMEAKRKLVFPLYFYFYIFSIWQYIPNYFQLCIYRIYVLTKNFLTKPTAKDSNYTQVSLPPVTDLELRDTFLNPKIINYKYPWIDFNIPVIYEIKTIKLQIYVQSLLLLYKKILFFIKKGRNSKYYLEPITHNIVKWLNDYDYFRISIPHTINILEQVSIFTLKNNLHNYYWLLRILQKQKFFKRFLVRQKIWLYQNNDIFYFWGYNNEFNATLDAFKLPRKRGWPKKQETDYFEFEKEEVLWKRWNLQTLFSLSSFWFNFFLDKKYFPYSFNVFLLHRLLLFLIRPF